MRHGRLITAALTAIAVMAIAPAWAAAAPPPFVDDVSADFGAAGTGTTVVDPGSVRLAGTLVTEPFDGPGLPGGFTPELWSPAGTATVSGGALTVDAALVGGNEANGSGQVLEFNGTFSGAEFQNLGFGTTLNDGPWAVFGTSGPNRVAARTTLVGVTDQVETVLPAEISSLTPHDYRIEWSAGSVRYVVDGVLQATHNVVIPSHMRPVVSDLTASPGDVVTANSLSRMVFPLSGTFTSAVHDAGDTRAVWGTLTPTVAATVGESSVAFQTRSSTDGTTWSAPADLGAGGAIQSPPGRFIQYIAALHSSATHVSPSVDRVQIDYDLDTTGPTTAVDPVQVSATTATVAFSSAAADLAGFECSLDGGAFAACTSPAALTGLAAGAHSVSVRGVDKLGNRGPDVATPFTIDAPQGPGGGATQQPGGGSSTVDKTKPKVSVVAKSLKVSKTGTVSFRVGCPKAETSCKIQLQLKNGKKVAAKKTVTVKGGKTVTMTLQLTKATRLTLSKHSKLKVSTVVTATDAAGNRKTTTQQLTLRRAAG